MHNIVHNHFFTHAGMHTSTDSLGGEGAVLAVANALQLQALGVEHSQKRARQARTLDGPDALLGKVGRCCRICGAILWMCLMDLHLGHILLFGLGILVKLVNRSSFAGSRSRGSLKKRMNSKNFAGFSGFPRWMFLLAFLHALLK